MAQIVAPSLLLHVKAPPRVTETLEATFYASFWGDSRMRYHAAYLKYLCRIIGRCFDLVGWHRMPMVCTSWRELRIACWKTSQMASGRAMATPKDHNDHMNIRILHSGSKAQDKWHSTNHGL